MCFGLTSSTMGTEFLHPSNGMNLGRGGAFCTSRVLTATFKLSSFGIFSCSRLTADLVRCSEAWVISLTAIPPSKLTVHKSGFCKVRDEMRWYGSLFDL